MDFSIDRPATPEQMAAIATALTSLSDPAPTRQATPAQDATWRVAARVEGIGLVRRLPGKLELRFMSAPTRERLERATRTLANPSSGNP